MGHVVDERKVLVGECKQVGHGRVDLHFRQRVGLTGELLPGLVEVVQIQMNVPEGVHKLTRDLSKSVALIFFWGVQFSLQRKYFF